ncbi:MAG: hypothetical protein F9K18_08500, partial [Thermoanaerobaculia bacterium]
MPTGSRFYAVIPCRPHAPGLSRQPRPPRAGSHRAAPAAPRGAHRAARAGRRADRRPALLLRHRPLPGALRGAHLLGPHPGLGGVDDGRRLAATRLSRRGDPLDESALPAAASLRPVRRRATEHGTARRRRRTRLPEDPARRNRPLAGQQRGAAAPPRRARGAAGDPPDPPAPGRGEPRHRDGRLCHRAGQRVDAGELPAVRQAAVSRADLERLHLPIARGKGLRRLPRPLPLVRRRRLRAQGARPGARRGGRTGGAASRRRGAARPRARLRRRLHPRARGLTERAPARLARRRQAALPRSRRRLPRHGLPLLLGRGRRQRHHRPARRADPGAHLRDQRRPRSVARRPAAGRARRDDPRRLARPVATAGGGAAPHGGRRLELRAPAPHARSVPQQLPRRRARHARALPAGPARTGRRVSTPTGGFDLVVLSPHLDDGILSCGGRMARLAEEGGSALLVTLLAGDDPVDPPGELAASLRRVWNLPPGGVVAARRAEDRAAAARLGAAAEHWPFPEALYRTDADGTPLYPDLASLYGELHADGAGLVADLAARIAALPPAARAA